ncbi:MAG: biotin--[acetyl-CoA-carboxylase] ligase [Zoogloeaceae bacterium]|jgi:BirA family biotin operon repressor/biotin-[acetyl-CoA-carboxylase] ligase|nr:biotin--[acetyl-CoA-carboxylase] ligase [Zoogloeaceae bacterium]
MASDFLLALQHALEPLASRFHVEVLEECASTNALLLEQAGQGVPSGSVRIAKRQTAGRGRRGRVWVSSPEESLTFSLLWRWRGEAARLSGLSLALGLALVRALEGFGAAGLRLKWPNDVLYAAPNRTAAKLAGILVELASGPQETAVIVGVGLNLSAPFVPEQPVAGLAECLSRLPERPALLAALLKEMADILEQVETAGFVAPLRQEWQARHLWQNQPVRLQEEGKLLAEGVCRGVDETGALLLETATGQQRFMAGDLSLRAGGVSQ